VHYIRNPFADSGVTTAFKETSVNFSFDNLIRHAEAPS